MAVRTYNPGKVQVIVGGAILTGFASGTFVKVSRSEDEFKGYAGTTGEQSRAAVLDKSGMCEVTLASTSPDNALLEAITAADRVTGGAPIPIMVRDRSGTTLFFTETGWLQKVPDREFGAEVVGVAWQFRMADVRGVHGGND